MKKNDIIVIGVVGVLLALFLLTPGALDGFIALTGAHPFLMSFIKFALLATFGECIGLRITSGVYNRPGFGILPRAIIWGILGVVIGGAFTVYGTGIPVIAGQIGLPAGDSFMLKLVMSFLISLCMNFTFAPFFMTLHKITDTHIANNDGAVSCLLKPIPMAQILSGINWNALWGFVFKKTIPLFWVPMHTITFMLPGHFRVIFAAALGVALGVILAFSAIRSRQSK